MKKPASTTILFFLFCLLFVPFLQISTVKAENSAEVEVGIWLVNVEKVDLAASSFKLDFYLWFNFDPSEISLMEMKEFEFIKVHQQSTKSLQTQMKAT